MAEFTNKTLVKEVSVKGEDGLFSDPLQFGVSFQDVVDSERDSGTPTQWSLEQFLDSYLDFMRTNNWVVYGATAPKNTHAKIWIDTSQKQNNF